MNKFEYVIEVIADANKALGQLGWQGYPSVASVNEAVESLKPLADGTEIAIPRSFLMDLFRAASAFNGEAGYLGGGGCRPGDRDWQLLNKVQRMLDIENEPGGHYSSPFYRDAVAEELEQVNQIVAVGSIDGVLSTAAILGLLGAERAAQVGITWTQAFAVDKVDVTKWASARKVMFIDLGVNNKDTSMTKSFVERIQTAGHEIVAIADEHSRELWAEVMGGEEALKTLAIQPVTQGNYVRFTDDHRFLEQGSERNGRGNVRQIGSTGELIRESVYTLSDHQKNLVGLAAAADRMEFYEIGEIANKAIKANIVDDSRREYMARHFAFNMVADEKINVWVVEYDEIERNNLEIIAAKQDLGDGVIRVVTGDRKIDMTSLMKALYGAGAKVVICEGMMYDKSINGKRLMVSFGTEAKSVDLLAAVQAAEVPASGFTNKVNLEPQYEAAALTVIRGLFQ